MSAEGIEKALQPFTVMAKPVGSLCNMRCSYCYYSSSQTIMSVATLERLISQAIECSTGPVVNFIWHGGEPTLAGLGFFEKVVELQQDYLPKGVSCWNNLQTNGLLLDDSWCSLLAKHKFDVGISIDGTEESHDSFRRSSDGKGTYAKVASTIERLKHHGIKPDLICTVNSMTVKQPLAVYDALSTFDTGWIQFIPVINREGDRVTKESVNPEQFGDFLIEIFDRWVTRDFDTTEIQLFSEAIRVAGGGSAAVCYLAPTCGRAIIAEADGRIYSCDHYVNDQHLIGDIWITHLGRIVNSQRQTDFGQLKQTSLTEVCKACRWLKFCNGGCPKDRLFTDIDITDIRNYLCEGYMRFYEYVFPALKFITIGQKQKQSKADIMNLLREQVRRIWKDVGRNDPCPCGSEKKAKNCCWHKRL
ncbi:MAG: anaerobic sulfatase maturase [Oscillospiraceae bacterium]|nr:anaerobic sulfatase maturase [Oscillospiraceae bacterium]